MGCCCVMLGAQQEELEVLRRAAAGGIREEEEEAVASDGGSPRRPAAAGAQVDSARLDGGSDGRRLGGEEDGRGRGRSGWWWSGAHLRFVGGPPRNPPRGSTAAWTTGDLAARRMAGGRGRRRRSGWWWSSARLRFVGGRQGIRHGVEAGGRPGHGHVACAALPQLATSAIAHAISFLPSGCTSPDP